MHCEDEKQQTVVRRTCRSKLGALHNRRYLGSKGDAVSGAGVSRGARGGTNEVLATPDSRLQIDERNRRIFQTTSAVRSNFFHKDEDAKSLCSYLVNWISCVGEIFKPRSTALVIRSRQRSASWWFDCGACSMDKIKNKK